MAGEFIKGNMPDNATVIYKGFHKITASLFWQELINAYDKLNTTIMKNLEIFNLTNNTDLILSSRWFTLVSDANYATTEIDARLEEYLGQTGRMMLVKPVYAGLAKSRLAKAKEIFTKHKDFYHPMTAYIIRKILNID